MGEYVVVFQTREDVEGLVGGVVTWGHYNSKMEFYKKAGDLLKTYKILAQGISKEDAIKMCQTPKAKLAALTLGLKNLSESIFVLNETVTKS